MWCWEWHCKKAGHEVQVVASGTYEAWVRERGLGFYALETDVNVFSRDNAQLMDDGFIKQLQTSRKVLNPIMTEMGLGLLEATRESDVLITVEFGIGLLFDVMKENNLNAILVNPAALNPSNELGFVGMPAVPGLVSLSELV